VWLLTGQEARPATSSHFSGHFFSVVLLVVRVSQILFISVVRRLALVSILRHHHDSQNQGGVLMCQLGA